METSLRPLFTMLKESLNISSTNMRIKCQRMHLDTRKSPLQLPSGRHFCPRQQEDAGLIQEEPYEGVGGGGLASQLSWLQPFWLFCIRPLWSKGQFKVSQQIQGSWSWRWRKWWGPLPGTPWRRPARTSGPESRQSSLLTAVFTG